MVVWEGKWSTCQADGDQLLSGGAGIHAGQSLGFRVWGLGFRV